MRHLSINLFVAREFVQDALRPSAVAEALAPLLVAGAERSRMLEGLRGVRAALGTPGAGVRVARMAVELAGALPRAG